MPTETTTVERKREPYAQAIRIHGNPLDTLGSIIVLETVLLEYHDEELAHTVPVAHISEVAVDFVQREFEVNDKTITGEDVMLLIKQYVLQRYQEHTNSG